MAYTNYSDVVKVRNGFGYTHVDIGTVGNVYNIVVTDSGGRPIDSGTLLNIYDGQYELDTMTPLNLVMQYQAHGYIGAFQFLFGDTANTMLTAAVESSSKKNQDIYFTMSIYR